MNNLYIDNKIPSKVYIDNKKVTAIYIDDKKVWGTSITIEVNPQIDEHNDIDYEEFEELL